MFEITETAYVQKKQSDSHVSKNICIKSAKITELFITNRMDLTCYFLSLATRLHECLPHLGSTMDFQVSDLANAQMPYSKYWYNNSENKIIDFNRDWCICEKCTNK